MADYPDEIRVQAYAAVKEATAGSYTWGSVADAVLDAVAQQLGEHAAGKILASMEASGPSMRVKLSGADAVRRNMRRLHFETAARVASRAFLTEDDMKRIAARELAAGTRAVCEADLP